MAIPEGVVQSLIRNDLQHLQLVGRTYELVVLSSMEAITKLFTIWDPQATVEQRASSHPLAKAEALASVFHIDVPLIVAACPRSLGRPEWSVASGSPDDLVVLEGNHRMQAVALRASWLMPLPACIGVFVQISR